MTVRFILALTFLLTGSAASAASSENIPAGTAPVLRCVYDLVKSEPEVKTAEAYDIDGFRFAIEYTFLNRSGHTVIADLMLSGARHYSYAEVHDESQETSGEEMDFSSRFTDKLTSECHVSPAFDSLLPFPKKRADWQRIDLSASP